MEVHRTPTSVSRFLLEVFFSIHIGYAGVSMVFCAIPSASTADRSYSIPTVPLDLQYLSPFNIPPKVELLKDERFEGRIKCYIKPIVFGGDPKAEDNITWVGHEQHTQLVRWWNNLYRSVKRPPKPM